MSIDISLTYSVDNRDGVAAIIADSTILFSPREGFDADKLAALERDLGQFVTQRLNDAIKRGASK